MNGEMSALRRLCGGSNPGGRLGSKPFLGARFPAPLPTHAPIRMKTPLPLPASVRVPARAWFMALFSGMFLAARVGGAAASPGLLPAPDEQQQPAVASDGTNYFVVWEDRRNPTMWDIYGARVSPDGQMLDPGGIPISTNVENYQHQPSVAFDGTNYLVVWADDRDNHPPTGAMHIYGARVSRQGVVLDRSCRKPSSLRALPAISVWCSAWDYLN